MPLYGIVSCLATCIDLPATVWLDTMHWQPPHVRMGMKIDLVSSNFQASNCLVYEGLDEVLRIESRKGFVRQQCEIALRSFS
jgi:hypothetical protein